MIVKEKVTTIEAEGGKITQIAYRGEILGHHHDHVVPDDTGRPFSEVLIDARAAATVAMTRFAALHGVTLGPGTISFVSEA